MKQSGKRTVSLLLTVPIILSIFAFTPSVSAGEKEINLASGAAADGEFISVNEQFESSEGTLNLIMTGLKPENGS